MVVRPHQYRNSQNNKEFFTLAIFEILLVECYAAQSLPLSFGKAPVPDPVMSNYYYFKICK